MWIEMRQVIDAKDTQTETDRLLKDLRADESENEANLSDDEEVKISSQAYVLSGGEGPRVSISTMNSSVYTDLKFID